ncbi:MAG: hypothetical protein ACE5HP_12400, partial [Gemmatimonadota bacterium]
RMSSFTSGTGTGRARWGARGGARRGAHGGARRGPHGGVRYGALALGLLGLSGIASTARAQPVTELDAGRFEIRSAGRRLATESFAIRREGNVVKAVGRIVPAGGSGIFPFDVRLQTNRAFRPTTYGLRARSGPVEGVDGVWNGDRLRLHVASSEGERWKEFLTPGPVAVLERGVAHHYYLLFRQLPPDPSGARLTVIVPSGNEQATATVTGGAEETVELGGERIVARRYELRMGERRRVVWLDRNGRVLRVAFPAENRVAVRLP